MRCCKRLCRCCNYEEISMQEFEDLRNNNPNLILIDVRSPQEYDEGHLEGSILIPSYDIVKKIEKIIIDKNSIVVVYCQERWKKQKSCAFTKTIRI